MLKLPGAVLAQMRAAAESLMTDTCALEARQASTGEYGEPTEEYVLVDAAVPCRVITPAPLREAGEATTTLARETMLDVYRLIVPHDTALSIDQRVTLASSGEVFLVTDVLTGRTDHTDRQAMIVRAR
ncbi:MAG: DUF6093 family protein [Anaerolineae bacterium]|nr:DUF6093 family protein [Anaerolineae bacterium]